VAHSGQASIYTSTQQSRLYPLKVHRISFPSHGWIFTFSLSAAEENNKSLILLQPDGDSIFSCLAGCMVSCACAYMCVSVSVSLLLLLPWFYLPRTLCYREMVLKRSSGDCRYNGTKPLSLGQDPLGAQEDLNGTSVIFRLSLLRYPAGADLSFFSSMISSAWRSNKNSGRRKRDAQKRNQDAGWSFYPHCLDAIGIH